MPDKYMEPGNYISLMPRDGVNVECNRVSKVEVKYFGYYPDNGEGQVKTSLNRVQTKLR